MLNLVIGNLALPQINHTGLSRENNKNIFHVKEQDPAGNLNFHPVAVLNEQLAEVIDFNDSKWARLFEIVKTIRIPGKL